MSQVFYAKNPLVVNLFGQPGAGKSSCSAYIFSRLKMMSIDCEYVTEFAKDLVWQGRPHALVNQAYVFGKQCYRISTTYERTGCVITDSPLPLSITYQKNSLVQSDAFPKVVMDWFNYFNNISFLVRRVKPYNPNGRNQTEEESNRIGEEIKVFLNEMRIPYIEIDGNESGCEQAISIIKERLI